VINIHEFGWSTYCTVRIYLRNIEIQNVDVSRRIHQIDCCSWLIRLLLNLICKLLSRHVLQITFKRIPNYADAFLNTSYSGIGCQKWTSKTPPPQKKEKKEPPKTIKIRQQYIDSASLPNRKSKQTYQQCCRWNIP
jgi:hypothetical protein